MNRKSSNNPLSILRSHIASALTIGLMCISYAAGAQEPTENKRFSLGAIPSPREILAGLPAKPTARGHLPELVDLSDRFPTPGNQGTGQGSCVGWAVGYAARSYYNAQPGAGRSLKQSQIPSPAYIYNIIQNPHPTCNGGSAVISALEVLKAGALSLAEYPYDKHQCPAISKADQVGVSGFEIRSYDLVDPFVISNSNQQMNPDRVKLALAEGNPVVVTFEVTDSFFKLDRPGRPIWRPGKGEIGDGYHAVTFVAYNEEKQYFKFINSWGDNWSDNGFGRMSYNAYRQRAAEAFVMNLDQPPVPPNPEPMPVPENLGFTLPDISCGLVKVRQTGSEIELVGFVGEQDDLDAIERVVAGKNIKLSVELRPWPQCETLMTLDEPLSEVAKPGIDLPRDIYAAGDNLTFDARMADFQGYLHVAYIQADGNVVNLVQTEPLNLTTISPNSRMTFGDGKQGRAKFTISEPFGKEMIVVLASKSPLFEETRPKVETEREFLTALRKAILARPDRFSQERLISANYTLLTTQSEE